MLISLPWGQDFLQVELPDTWQVHMSGKESGSPVSSRDDADKVQEALKSPVGRDKLSSRNLEGKRVLIIVDDNTRPTPVHRFFQHVLEALDIAGVERRNISVLTALGIHTSMSESEMQEKIGRENLSGISWFNHHAFSPEIHSLLGTTSLGTPVELNTKVLENDLIILLGMIEPHLWAGFGGGLKNIFPGVASAQAIGTHHGLIAQPPYRFNRVGLMPENNSFRRDLEEIVDFIPGEVFCVNVTLTEDQGIEAAFAGDPLQCHRQGANHCTQQAGINVPGPVDGIIVNSHPMDINFKQSMKCVANALPALKPGGTIMAFLRAEKGLDDIPLPDKPPPLPVLKSILKIIGKSRVLGFLDLVKKDLGVEEKFLNYYTLRLIREYRLYCYVPSLSAQEVRHLGFFKKCETPQSVIDAGLKKLGKNAQVAVFPRGGSTFPVVAGENK